MTRGSALSIGLLVLGFGQLAQGAGMALDPGTFFDTLGTFGERNDHYIRDMATVSLALGLVALLARRRPSWRVPVLAFATAWFAFHGVNHIIDAGEADPESLGVFDAVSLLVITALLGWLLALARREETTRA